MNYHEVAALSSVVDDGISNGDQAPKKMLLLKRDATK